MLYDNLTAIAARAPRSGLRYRGTQQTYPQLLERVSRLAAGFMSRGIGPGSVVTILVPNSPDVFVALHAFFAIGAIGMPLSTTATRDEVLDASRKGGAAAVLADPALSALAGDVGEALGIPLIITDTFGDLERTAPAALPKLNGETPALYLLSSGSTGLPKIVPHTHAEILDDARRAANAWQLTPDDVVFDMLPSNFAMGLLLGATYAAENGASTVYWNDPQPLILSRRNAVETIANERVTFMGAVPAMYDTLAGAKGDHDLSHVRAFSGGAALKRSTWEAVRDRFGILLRQDYGSTEALMCCHNTSDDPDRDWASVGPMAGDAVAMIDTADHGLGEGVGELLIRAASVTRGYLGDTASTAASFRDGWLLSGDLARMSDTGSIEIVGRTKLLLEVAGFKIDPIEVEAALATHPAVAESAVVGIKDKTGGQKLKAVVVRAGDVSPEALIRHLRERLSVQKVPTLYEFRDALPRSPVGKLLRGQLSGDA